MHHFLFTLGSEFEPIQHNYRIGNLPDAWKTTSWLTLLILCRDFYNSVNPGGLVSKEPKSEHTSDRALHQRKIKNWFLQPVKFCKEIEAEQARHLGKCIYHLTKSHQTETCSTIKEFQKSSVIKQDGSAGVSTSNTAGTRSGHLRNIKEDEFMDAESDIVQDSVSLQDDAEEAVVSSNDTKEVSLHYFARLSNHYLRLVKSSPTLDIRTRHSMQYPVIADSGANFHMFWEKEFFESMSPASGTVLLGDGQTSLRIEGVGVVKCRIGDNIITIPDVRYILSLAESIYSLFVHIQQPGYGLYSSFDEGLFINFPDFQSKAIVGDADIYLDIHPVDIQRSGDPVLSSGTGDISTDVFCRNVTKLQDDITAEIGMLDDILRRLRRYYSEVKTKRRLGLNVPAGFRSSSTLQQNYQAFTPPRRAKTLSSNTDTTTNILPAQLYYQLNCYQTFLQTTQP